MNPFMRGGDIEKMSDNNSVVKITDIHQVGENNTFA